MIELRRLRYLVVLAKRLSYSRAASDIGISQSALSRAIQSLEQEMGLQLFDRDRSGVNLTEQGRWVVERAEALLVSATDFNHQLSFAKHGQQGRTRFGMIEMAAYALLPSILHDRLIEIPDFSHEILVREVEPLWLMLAQGEIEFLVCAGWDTGWQIPDELPMRIEPLGEMPLALVVRSGHPVIVDGKGTKGYPILVSNTGTVPSHLTKSLRHQLASSIQVIENYGVLSSVVRTTDAIWLSSPYAVADEIARGELACIPLPDEIELRSFTLSMYSLLRRTQSAATQELKAAFHQRIKDCEMILAKSVA